MATGDGNRERRTRRTGSPGRSAGTTKGDRHLPATRVLGLAREQFEEITGRDVETVSAVTRKGQDWELHVEVLELARIPETTSVLATYVVRLDAEGNFLEYERLRRYTRGQVDV
ncbi:gas vesicle protein [Saccharomonospora sp. NPDC006951]